MLQMWNCVIEIVRIAGSGVAVIAVRTSSCRQARQGSSSVSYIMLP